MKRVLLVEDMKFMRMILRQMLTHGGYEVVGEASNGQEAITLYQSLSPDLTIMDICLPELDGMSALQKIKQYDSHAKVIICSSFSHKQAVISVINAGALDFITKPISQELLLHSVKKALSDDQGKTERRICIS